MANAFYERGSSFNPDELADGDAIEAEFDAVVRGFDTIETQIDTNKAGYPTQTFHVAPATEPTHAIQQDQLEAALSFKLDAVNYNAADVLNKLKTVDGYDSGLDADCLDGQHGSYYRNADNINAGTLAKERLPGTIDSSTTGNAATATKVAATAPIGGDVDLVTGAMGGNDFFRIRCFSGGYDDGHVEIATADGGNEPILVRQYNGQFGSVARTLTLLDGSGNTVIPGGVWSIPNNAFLNTVSVITGTAYHGNWLPIPDGYSEGQCRFFISMNNTNPHDNSWDLRDGISTQHYSEYCRLINNRQVDAVTRVYNDVSDAYQFHGGIVNYIVIGVK